MINLAFHYKYEGLLFSSLLFRDFWAFDSSSFNDFISFGSSVPTDGAAGPASDSTGPLVVLIAFVKAFSSSFVLACNLSFNVVKEVITSFCAANMLLVSHLLKNYLRHVPFTCNSAFSLYFVNSPSISVFRSFNNSSNCLANVFNWTRKRSRSSVIYVWHQLYMEDLNPSFRPNSQPSFVFEGWILLYQHPLDRHPMSPKVYCLDRPVDAILRVSEYVRIL